MTGQAQKELVEAEQQFVVVHDGELLAGLEALESAQGSVVKTQARSQLNL